MLFCVVLVVGVLASSARQAQPHEGLAKVDPRVLEDTAGGNVGNFLVLLAMQADLGARAGNISEDRRVENAYSQLSRVATGNQREIVITLERLARDPALSVSYREFWLVDGLAVRGTRQVVDELAAMPEVFRIEPDRAFVAASRTVSAQAPAQAASQANLIQIGVTKVWAMSDTGQGIVYANADTGVQWSHPALKNQYRGWDAASETVDHNYNWWDAVRENINTGTNPCGYASPEPCDDDVHGTHTLGIGVGDDHQANHIGVAPGARWIACRNMDQKVGRPSTYIDCLQFLMAPTDLNGANRRPDLHADVISNSYSCPVSEGCTAQDVLHQAVEAVRSAGIFMAVSVGNEGCGTQTGLASFEPPAVEPDVFTVGAVNAANQIADFSSRGPATYQGTQYLKPDLVAPGIAIRSSVPVTAFNQADPYQTISGTSMSAPEAAGVVALLWSAYPQLRGQVRETEQLLESSARHLEATSADLCSQNGSTGTPNNAYGYGLLDAWAAYDLLARHHYLPIVAR